MNDQKEIVREIYLKIANDEGWMAEYRADPEKLLSESGLNDQNIETMKEILAMY